MKQCITLLGLMMIFACTVFAVEGTPAREQPEKAMEESSLLDIKLPADDSVEYWNLRSEAVSEFIPFLTKKRTEMRKNRQMMADYLIKIGKANEFAAKEMPVPTDMKVYTDMMGMTQKLKDANIMPKKRPSWDDLVEVVMKHVIDQGYLPTEIEEGAEAEMYKDLCRRKEQYGIKIRKDLVAIQEQAARMWVYLDSIKELDKYKVYLVDLQLEKKSARAEERAMVAEQQRAARIARAQEAEENKFQDAQDRASFRSSRRERGYDSRQDRLQYRQSLLDERFVNSRRYYW